MRVVLKLGHFLAGSAFVGSIFGHILLGTIFAASEREAYQAILQAKAAMTDVLIFGGLAVAVLSGVGLVLIGGGKRLFRPWLMLKLAAVAAIIANAQLVLRPAGLERIALASTALAEPQVLAAFNAAGLREELFGAINLGLVLAVIALSVAKKVPFLPTFPRARRA